MPNNILHFAVHADDPARARRFYESVFGWQFQPWGPPDFFLIRTGTQQDPGIEGDLQARTEMVKGKKMFGYECTIAVSDVDATAAAVQAQGGKIIMPKCTIPTVGQLIFFEDSEGNLVGAMQYDKDYHR